MFLAEWHVGQVFFSLLWFALFVVWIWLLISVFVDIFRSHDMGGFAKALWVIFVVVLPYLGVLVYLIARGGSMHERAIEQAQRYDAQMQQYVQSVATGGSTSNELERLAGLRDQGAISEDEFQQLKAKAIASA